MLEDAASNLSEKDEAGGQGGEVTEKVATMEELAKRDFSSRLLYCNCLYSVPAVIILSY